MKRILKRLVNSIRLIFSYQEIKSLSRKEDNYWNERKKRTGYVPSLNSFQKYRADWVLSRVEDNDLLLDIGAGDGAIDAYLRENKHLSIICADKSEVALASLRELDFEVYKLDIESDEGAHIPFQPDHLLLFEVLEHLLEPELLLTHVLSITRKSVFFSVPNSGYFVYRLRLLFGKFPVQWISHPGEHCRFWTMRDMKWWLAELGLEGRSEVQGYEGITLLNCLAPSIFSKGLIVRIDAKTLENVS